MTPPEVPSAGPDPGLPPEPIGELVDAPPAEEAAPPLRSQVLQLFLYPMMIAAVGVGIFFLFWYLTHERKTFDEYLEGLKSRSESQRYQAAYDLAEEIAREGPGFVGPKGAAKLAETFSGARGEPKLRQYLAAALARLADPVSVPALLEGLSDEALEVRLFSSAALGRIGDASAIGGLVAALDEDESSEVRANVAAALGAIGDAKAVPALVRTLGDADPITRTQAAVSLAFLGDRSGVPALVPALDRAVLDGNARLKTESDKESMMRNAISALAQIRPAEVEPVMRRVADSDPSLGVRAAAREYLEGGEAEPPPREPDPR